MLKFSITKKGDITYDKEIKDKKIVKYKEDIETYMERDVFPHVPDAKCFFEENLGAKKACYQNRRRNSV